MSLAGSATLESGQSGAIPRLAEPFEPIPAPTADPGQTHDGGKKQKKRGLFGFGKKRADDAHERQTSPAKNEPSTTPGHGPIRRMTGSPELTHIVMPSSPNRNLSSSPRISSPAGSQIFERDVQENNSLIPNSPAIPSHIQTENYIPPVLCASSEAITDGQLDPDSVEIITHSSHQPAAVTVTGVGGGIPQSPAAASNDAVNSWADELVSYSDRDAATDSASNYGSFDATDVRRLSFISFADVVQAEHGGNGMCGGGGGSQRDSIHLAGLTSLASVGLTNRSPSPIRSPVSSAGGGPGTSPPTSKSGSIKGLDLSPARKPLGSPTSAHHHAHHPQLLPGGELNIETMSQALRRTGSRDMSSFRSVPTSPVEGPSR